MLGPTATATYSNGNNNNNGNGNGDDAALRTRLIQLVNKHTQGGKVSSQERTHEVNAINSAFQTARQTGASLSDTLAVAVQNAVNKGFLTAKEGNDLSSFVGTAMSGGGAVAAAPNATATSRASRWEVARQAATAAARPRRAR